MEGKQALAARMKEFFARQEECYRRVLDLSRRQVATIEARDTALLMRILSDKQAVMREVEAVAQGGATLLKEWEAGKNALGPGERESVERAHESVKAVLAEVLQVEEAAREELGDRTSEQSRKITELQRGKQMLRAYGRRPRKDEGRFMDNTK
ncbi:MAG: flagellar export chaperone FlgN [Planctomycetota bacterium]